MCELEDLPELPYNLRPQFFTDAVFLAFVRSIPATGDSLTFYDLNSPYSHDFTVSSGLWRIRNVSKSWELACYLAGSDGLPIPARLAVL